MIFKKMYEPKISVLMPCLTCGGAGLVVEDGQTTPCPTCGGVGTVEV